MTRHDTLRPSILLAPVVVATCLALAASAFAAPASWDKPAKWTIPDLSQYNNPAWVSYCAPTSATNALWAFSAGDAGLIQAGANKNAKADATITTLAGAAYMNTNGGGFATGTTTANLMAGLLGYTNAFSSFGPNHYTVSLLTAFNTGLGGGLGNGQTLWAAMQNELYISEEVLPLISFTGPPNNASEVEALKLNYDEGEGTGTPNTGHVVTMVGYTTGPPNTIKWNDPGNNGFGAGTHSWVRENTVSNINPMATSLNLTSGPYANAWIVGAVTLSPVPEPASLLLVASAVVALGALRRRS